MVNSAMHVKFTFQKHNALYKSVFKFDCVDLTEVNWEGSNVTMMVKVNIHISHYCILHSKSCSLLRLIRHLVTQESATGLHLLWTDRIKVQSIVHVILL